MKIGKNCILGKNNAGEGPSQQTPSTSLPKNDNNKKNTFLKTIHDTENQQTTENLK